MVVGILRNCGEFVSEIMRPFRKRDPAMHDDSVIVLAREGGASPILMQVQEATDIA